MKEIWKDIEGYEGCYQISNLGNYRTIDRKVNHLYGNRLVKGGIKKKWLSNSGYYYGDFSKNGCCVKQYLHILTAKAFIPNLYSLPCVNHKDENKLNNFVWVNDDGSVDLEKSNLEWCTYSYNNSYGTKQERIRKKRINGVQSKPVLQYDINGNYIKEWPSVREVTRKLGYDNSTISACCRGKFKQRYGYIWKYKLMKNIWSQT